LNSRLSWFFLKRLCSVLGDPDKKGRLELREIHLETFPICKFNITNLSDKAHYDKVVSLVDQMLDLHKRLHSSESASESEIYQRQINSTDRQIDNLVYGLYGLTDEEIKIVEER